MDSKKLKEPSIRLKSSVKSSMRLGQPDRKESRSSQGLTTCANNTSPIMCAVCGSKEYVTLHSHDKCNYPFASGWNSPEVLKKNLSMEFPQTFGPLSPLTQAIFPHLSLFHFPSNFYCSHYNSNLRFPPTPCEPIEKYFGLEVNGSKAATVNSESTLYRDRETKRRVVRGSTFRKEESCRKDDSRPSSAFTNLSEVRNYPVPVHPPWMGNLCPVFPYTYASWAFPFNQPIFPIYLPMSGKWHGVETQNEEENIDGSASNSPMGDSNSVQNETEKKSDEKDENNASEYDFEVFARELMLEQKSNFDEDEVDIEVNLDEIANSLKTSGVDSGREINSEKFFNSKEKLGESREENCRDKDGMRSWRPSSDVNMQDCCIRTLSNENLWYEAQEEEKKNWNGGPDCNWKENGFTNSKHNLMNGDRGKADATPAWKQDRCKTDEMDAETRLYWKKNPRRSKVSYEESQDINCDTRREWSKSEMNDEMEFSDDKISSSEDSSRLRDLHIINDQRSKLDIPYNYADDADNTSQTSNRETARPKEDNYSVQINTIQIEYSIQGIQNFKKEEEEMLNHDSINFNWDKINEILDDYNEKFTEVGLVLKNKQVLGAKMAKAYSLINDRKQKDSISDIRTDNSKNLYGDKKIENKSTGSTQPSSPTSVNSKLKKDEKSRSFGYTSNRYESPKIPVSSARKSKKQEDTKKRWLT